MGIFLGNAGRRSEGLIKRYFSLLEVLIAVIILVIMMGMMFYIISSAQKSFKLQETKTLMYQKSRLVFDLIERDIRSMVTSQTLYKEIGYYVFTSNSPTSAASDADYIANIVTSGDPDDNSTSRLSEVIYAFHTDSSEPSERYVLRRQVVNETNGDDWNFVGAPLNWQYNKLTTSPGFETVIGGVDEFSIRFEEQGGTTASTGTTHTSQPIRAIINLRLFDESLSGDEFSGIRSKTMRGFTKIIYIGHIHSR